LTEKEIKKLDENVIAIKAPSSRAYWIKMKLSLKLTPELARIIGHILGDGNIKISSGRNVRYGSPDIVLLNSFIRDMLKVFGKVKYSIGEKRVMNCKFYEAEFPSVIGRILLHFFGPFGSHTGKIPKVIIKANRKIKREVIKALFDDEGSCVYKYSSYFGIVNKPLIIQVAKILREFGIRVDIKTRENKSFKKNLWFIFYLNGTNLRLFWKRIGLTENTKK
jgi:hypothetical protein